jgi:hypothetical protein
MATSFDPAGFVRQFLQKVDQSLEHYPAPFDYTAIEAGNTTAKLPVGLLGKLSQLREIEDEITARFVWERGSLTQTCISRGAYKSTVYDRDQRTLDLKEEKERSAARERWFCDLSDGAKTAFERYCLAAAGPTFVPLLPAALPSSLHGAGARLALEAAELARRYRTRRSQTEKSLRGRGLSNPTVMPGLLQQVDHDEQAALSKLVGRWRRELTPEQQAVFDGAIVSEPVQRRPGSRPKIKRQRRARVAELLLALLDDRTYANRTMTELASLLSTGKKKCSVSAVSRAFRHPVYGPRIKQRYEQYGIKPPTIDQL